MANRKKQKRHTVINRKAAAKYRKGSGKNTSTGSDCSIKIVRKVLK
jgi:hypothetical protein